MDTTKTEKTEGKKEVKKKVGNEDRRDVFIDRGNPGDDPNLYVCINGRSFLLPRGKVSNVPVYVAEEIERTKRAQIRYDETMDRLKDMAK